MTERKLTKIFNKVETKVNNLTDEQSNVLFDKMDESWESAAKYLSISLREFATWMYCD